MKRRRGIILVVILVLILAAVFAGYNIYRYPAAFRSLSDRSLDEAAVNQLADELSAAKDKNILVAYFSHSGTTRGVAAALSEETGGDLFEISPAEEYSNVYAQSNSEIRNNERPALADTVENMDEYEIVFVGSELVGHRSMTGGYICRE